MRIVDEIIIHCSYTPSSMDIGVEEIRKWHTDPKPKGNGWSDIGYHFVITRSGDIQVGRPLERTGAHTKGHNKGTIGICWVGGMNEAKDAAEDNRTDIQKELMLALIDTLIERFPTIKKISGHRDYANRDCPCYNAREEHKHQLKP